MNEWNRGETKSESGLALKVKRKMKAVYQVASKRRFFLAPVFLTVFAAACTNTSTPLNGLFAKKQPAVPTATQTQRETARQELAIRLQNQKKDLQAKNVAAVKPVAPKESVDVSRLRPAAKTSTVASLSPKPETSAAENSLNNVATVASIPRVAPVKGAFGPLGRFHAKLAALKSGQRKRPITILHIGDSHVASDSFSRGIRTSLQARYGDAGRGMVLPAAAFKYGVADQVKLSTSGRWRGNTALKSRRGKFGISGVSVSSRSSKSSMTLKSKSGPFDWAEVTVAAGPSQGAFTMKAGTVSKRFDAYSKNKGSKTFRINARGRSLKVTPGGGAQTTILNWATGKNRAGIRYVNFGLIGATVDITKRFDKKLVANDVRRLDPDLIIYGYGTNEGFNDNLDLSAYAKRATRYVKTLKASAPNADLVYLGAASGLRKKGNRACGGWSVPRKLGPLRKTMRKLASQQNAGYWDWSAKMGGVCGINAWAKKGLAAKDRIHLTSKGYRTSANAFAKWLMQPSSSNVEVALN